MADPFLDQVETTGLGQWWTDKVAEGKAILISNDIRAEWWGYKLFNPGVAQDLEQLDQALKVVLTTAQGTDVHRPEFSTGIWNYIDYPIPRATAPVVRDSTEAVERWEPRVTLETVDVLQFNPELSSLTVNVSWQVADSSVAAETTVEVTPYG